MHFRLRYNRIRWSIFILLAGYATALSFPLDDQASPSANPIAIEAHVTLDTGWAFPLVNLREPVRYHLRIIRHADVMIRPESIAPAALQRALVRATALPAAVFDITAEQQQTTPLDEQRAQDMITYTLRISTPGRYRIPALNIAYVTSQAPSGQQLMQSQPQQGYWLTIPSYLPAESPSLPGDIIAPAIWQRRLQPWRMAWPQYVAYGLWAGGAGMLVAGLLWRKPRRRRTAGVVPLSASQLRHKYLAEFNYLQERTPATSGPLSSTERTWLRDCATLLRQLLGECSTGDATCFTGAAGVSAEMITAHLQMESADTEALLAEPLHLLDELSLTATAMAPALTADDYARMGDHLERMIRHLTDQEVSRVLRVSPRP
ncbi:MAG: hypothetical protein OEU26_13910 [Candidatus Tectomicrobia bacterium]|nr:hypothetical protein [Candidatus Tectomicrobia bacterium]